METITKTRKIGGSLVVTIPRAIVEEQGLTENQAVKINVQKLKKNGFGMFPQLGEFTKEDRIKFRTEKDGSLYD